MGQQLKDKHETCSRVLNYNIPMAKTVSLSRWVCASIEERDGSFLSTRELYEQYCNDITHHARVTEGQFMKDIEPLLLAYTFSVGKVRTATGRGYVGISFKEFNQSVVDNFKEFNQIDPLRSSTQDFKEFLRSLGG